MNAAHHPSPPRRCGGSSPIATLLESAHVLALATWMACLVAAGVAAMGVFSTLPRLDLVLPRFEAYVEATTPPDLRAREFGRIAGGLVMEPIFRGTDLAQAIAAAVAVATMLGQFVGFPRRWPAARPSSVLRVLLVVGAALLVAWHAIVVAPRMDQALHAWWTAAAANDPAAAGFRAAFDLDHQQADLFFRVRLLLVVAALALSVCRAPDSSQPSGAE